jgi:hypothetical protein
MRGLLLSLAIHGVLVFASVLAWPHVAKSMDMDSAIVPIDVVSFSETSNISPIAAENALTAPTAEEAGAPLDAGKATEAEAVPDLTAPKPKTPPPTQKPQQKFSLDQLSALIDRSKKTPGTGQQTTSPSAPTGEKPRTGFGAKSGLTASIEDYLASVFERCWRSTQDMPNPERLIVTVRVTLNRDGTLASDPRTISAVLPGDAQMNVAAQNALRAVRTCGPYKLPAESFAEWRELDLRFGVKGLIQ